MEPQGPLRHAKHIFRVFLLLLVAVVALVLGRDFLVPPTFGQYGHFRAANVEQQRNLAVRHGGDESCRPCHATQYDAHAAGPHMTVRCELCHAPVSVHAAGGKKISAMPVRKSSELCALCHERLGARPQTQPQIQFKQHVLEKGSEPSPESCFDCHDPHSPL
ncbi:MAG: cytochrome C [bacterium]